MTDATEWTPPDAHADIGAFTPEQAQAAQTALMGDKNFSAAFAKNDPVARNHWRSLTDATYRTEAYQPTAAVLADETATPATKATAARAELNRLQQNKTWTAKYVAGDLDARKLFNELTTVAAGVSDLEMANAPGTDTSAYSDVRITLQPDDD